MKKRIVMLIIILIHISVLFWGSFTDNMIITYVWHGVTLAGSLYYLFKEKKQIKDLGKIIKKNWMYIIVASLITGLLYYGSNVLLEYFIGGSFEINSESVSQSNLVFVIINLLLWAPIVEETIMRYLYKETIVNKYAFIIISTLFFGLIHSISIIYPINYILMAALPYFVIGVYLSILYEKLNNIYLNILLHFIINAIGVVMILCLI